MVGKLTSIPSKTINVITKFGVGVTLGAIVVLVSVSILGEFLGGLVGGAVLAGVMGQEVLGIVVMFDSVLSLFRPQPSGGI